MPLVNETKTYAEAMADLNEALAVVQRKIWDQVMPIFERVAEAFKTILEVGVEVVGSLAALLKGLDVEGLLWDVAIQDAGIPESDIRSVDVDEFTVRLWNRRVIDLHPYFEDAA